MASLLWWHPSRLVGRHCLKFNFARTSIDYIWNNLGVKRSIFGFINVLRLHFCALTIHSWLNRVDEDDWWGWGWLERKARRRYHDSYLVGRYAPWLGSKITLTFKSIYLVNGVSCFYLKGIYVARSFNLPHCLRIWVNIDQIIGFQYLILIIGETTQYFIWMGQNMTES